MDRPTKDAHFHSSSRHHEAEDQEFILSGIDELAGGTWFGLNRAGRVALLTNIYEPPQDQIYSTRGCLVSSYLSDEFESSDEPLGFIPRDTKFAGFNLLLFEPEQEEDGLRFEVSFVSNGGAGGELTSRPLSPEEQSCGGMSNGVDGKGANEWPKVVHGTKALDTVLKEIPVGEEDTQIAERLFRLLSWQSPEPVTEPSERRNTIHIQPMPTGPGYYATRLSTVVLIRRDGQVLFIERDVWKLVDGKMTTGQPSEDRVFRFSLDLKKRR